VSGYSRDRDKHIMEIITYEGKILEAWDISDRIQDARPDKRQIAEHIYFMDLKYEENKVTEKIEVRKFDMNTKKLTTH
jgi:hypothetical protein